MTIYTSPTCSKCKQLKKVLTEKNIPFTESEDIDSLMEKTDIMSLPVVEKNGVYIGFTEIFKWALAQEAQS